MTDDDLLAIADAEIRQLRADLTAALEEARSSTRVAEALATENAGPTGNCLRSSRRRRCYLCPVYASASSVTLAGRRTTVQ